MASLHQALIQISLLYYTTTVSDKSCYTSKQCVDQDLTDPGHTTSYGYKSASGDTTSFSGGSIKCSGSFSCDAMAFITANSGISCLGKNACSHTTLKSGTKLDCEAPDACSFSNITKTVGNLHASVHCLGYVSCRNAYIIGVEEIEGSGSLSLYKSIIDSMDTVNNTITITLDASLSGFGATLICRNNHICYIHCKGLDSCYMFYTECIGQCIVTTAASNVIAPINVTIPPFFDSESVDTSNDESCVIETWNFDDYQAHYNLNVDINVTDQGPMCCRGRQSCYVSIGNKIDFETTNNNDIICAGHSACITSSIITNNGTVYCEGQSACVDSSIVYAQDVYCDGRWSCGGSLMTKVKHIRCSGFIACRSVTFISDGDDLIVYFGGREAGLEATLYCNKTDSCNIYCSGDHSCLNMILYCNENCKINCDATVTQCPLIYGSSAPSYPPMHPSVIPTKYPSVIPSKYPSVNPSKYPSGTSFNQTPINDIPTSSTTLPNTYTSSEFETSFMRSLTNTMSTASPQMTVRTIIILIVASVTLLSAISLVYILFMKKRQRQRDQHEAEKNVAKSMEDNAEDDVNDNDNHLSDDTRKKHQEQTRIASVTDILDEQQGRQGGVDDEMKEEDSSDEEGTSDGEDMYVVQKVQDTKRTETAEQDATSKNEGGERVQSMAAEGKNVNEIVEWLQSMGMSEYVHNFVNNGFHSLQTVMHICEYKTLERMGIVLVAHQLTILAEIAKLRNNEKATDDGHVYVTKSAFETIETPNV